MSFFSILETLLIGPLKLIFEIIFEFANRLVGHPGLAIIFLSLVMNILVLPLYRRADAMQEASRDTEAKLHDGVAHIKKTFSGDERMMILQTYYKQNHYKPTNALNGSISLLLEIPFFMAAYQFLSHLEILNGVSFGPIRDLGAPDGLLVIGGLAINVLPILMTLINVISSAMYLKGFPLKTKIQLYGMALFFLVFLYTSPSCLVFYWTLNNLFSLVKTIFYKLKHPQKVLRILMATVGTLLLVFGAFIYDTNSLKRKAFVIGIAVLLLVPLVWHWLKQKLPTRQSVREPQPNRKVFWLGALFLTVLVGLLIPSTFIAASPQEYVDPTYFHNPLWYIVSAFCLAAGTFLVWMGVFYWLASPKGKEIFDKLVWILCGGMLANYMFFGTDLGVISSVLQYENGLTFTRLDKLINLLVLIALAAVFYFVVTKWKKVTTMVLLTAVVALGGMSVVNMVTINKSVAQIAASKEDSTPHFNLSKDGQNVVVIMLDRALGQCVPYLMNERPELKEQFDGFTYYSNTISYGSCTNFGVPPLLGGYEYTPVEMNKRDDEKLVDKHNEAVLLMPTVFSENGYDVTVCDPVYPNYQWIPDLSVFDDDPNIKAYITKGRFGEVDQKMQVIANNHRNFFCFSIMKSMPLALQPTIYNGGQYNQIIAQDAESNVYAGQKTDGKSKATGIKSSFMNSYNVLTSLPYMTKVTETGDNTFLFLSNDTTHETMLLNEPDYTPSQTVDNTEYDAAHSDRFTLNGETMKMENATQMAHYQTNMAALIQLGNWFDHLRESGVYDNTKIILVADHGYGVEEIDDYLVRNDREDWAKDIGFYSPLLMVKDFNSEGYTVSDTFMTNADVPLLAMKDLIENPKNPFTGKALTDREKYAHDQYVILSQVHNVEKNNGNTFLPSQWASVKDDMRDDKNWTFYDKEVVLSEHAAP